MTSRSPVAPDIASIEEFLRSVWLEALDVEQLSPHDNFIERGGDSISAAVCLNRIHIKFGVSLNFNVLLVRSLSGVASAIAEALQVPKSAA